MNSVASLLVPLDGSALAARSLGCAAWLARRMNAQLRVLQVGPSSPFPDLQIPAGIREHCAIQQRSGDPAKTILDEIAHHGARLLVLSARGDGLETDSGEPRLLGHVSQSVVEQSPVPVLVLPEHYRERLPWQRLLVPVSGEPSAEHALAVAVELANDLDLSVTVAHVVDPEHGETGDGSLVAAARYADAPHHELPEAFDEMISRALPQFSQEDTRCIRGVSLCHGDIAGELLKLAAAPETSAVAVGWHGRFAQGHAEVLKQLLDELACPLLLVRPRPRLPFRIKVGAELD
ncbi:MAG: universal stress protein [Gammaproteobacteria bacterium]|nr:universal stress protein [Gammaproteobacteria bacterium]